MPPVVHFEIPADIPERARYFYTKLFGWKIERMDGELDYYIVSAKQGKNGIDGGLMKRKHPQQPFTNYILVEDIEDTLEKVKRFGGTVVLEKMPISGMGWIAAFKDTENNLLGLWQEDNTAPVSPTPDANPAQAASK